MTNWKQAMARGEVLPVTAVDALTQKVDPKVKRILKGIAGIGVIILSAFGVYELGERASKWYKNRKDHR